MKRLHKLAAIAALLALATMGSACIDIYPEPQDEEGEGQFIEGGWQPDPAAEQESLDTPAGGDGTELKRRT